LTRASLTGIAAALAVAVTGAAAPDAMAGGAGHRLEIVRSEAYGPVVADRRGEALYLFTKEKSARSECYGACAKAWPPLFTKRRPRAGDGIRKRLLGTTRRRGGRLQVTYRGHPLYYYVSDRPGLITCQDVFEFGGRWLVVGPDGRAVR
jgi:predicted lipoprotein with Yx(FWY)xxD motif